MGHKKNKNGSVFMPHNVLTYLSQYFTERHTFGAKFTRRREDLSCIETRTVDFRLYKTKCERLALRFFSRDVAEIGLLPRLR